MIHVNGVSRTFQCSKSSVKHALYPVSFNVEKGEVFGLLGPNGAGKTTLLRILASVIKPSDGTAILNNYDVRVDSVNVKKSIGFLSGNTKLYGRLTPRELLTYFGRLYEMADARIHERINELIAYFDIGEFVDRRIDKLSTGQAQRVSVARCVLPDPPIYVFDEPTLGLDIISSRTIIEFMRNAGAEGKTVIFSTHYMEEVERLCKRIGFLHEGKLVAVDTVDGYRMKTELTHVADIFLEYVRSANGECL